MKFNAKYQLGKGLAFLGLAALPFAGCEKDPEPIQKHNVELTYGRNPDSQWQNISMDTLYKYNADPKVDTIFMVPEYYAQWETFNANQLRYCINRLRPRHNINPNKIFGKGDLVLNSMVTTGNPEIVRFFQDTLRYRVINPGQNR